MLHSCVRLCCAFPANVECIIENWKTVIETLAMSDIGVKIQLNRLIDVSIYGTIILDQLIDQENVMASDTMAVLLVSCKNKLH